MMQIHACCTLSTFTCPEKTCPPPSIDIRQVCILQVQLRSDSNRSRRQSLESIEESCYKYIADEVQQLREKEQHLAVHSQAEVQSFLDRCSVAIVRRQLQMITMKILKDGEMSKHVKVVKSQLQKDKQEFQVCLILAKAMHCGKKQNTILLS